VFFQSLYAEQASSAVGPNLLEILMMPLGFILIMYFFIIRPQQKKMKTQELMLAQLKPGDQITTTGGILGKIHSLSEKFIQLEVGNDTTIKILKEHIHGRYVANAKHLKSKKSPSKA